MMGLSPDQPYPYEDAASDRCPFDGTNHEFEQKFSYEKQDYYYACRKCGHEPQEEKGGK